MAQSLHQTQQRFRTRKIRRSSNQTTYVGVSKPQKVAARSSLIHTRKWPEKFAAQIHKNKHTFDVMGIIKFRIRRRNKFIPHSNQINMQQEWGDQKSFRLKTGNGPKFRVQKSINRNWEWKMERVHKKTTIVVWEMASLRVANHALLLTHVLVMNKIHP